MEQAGQKAETIVDSENVVISGAFSATKGDSPLFSISKARHRYCSNRSGQYRRQPCYGHHALPEGRPGDLLYGGVRQADKGEWGSHKRIQLKRRQAFKTARFVLIF